MELLDKWWQSSSSLTLADFRKLIHNYSVFRDIDLLVRVLIMPHIFSECLQAVKLFFARIWNRVLF